jgi:aminopeptidase
MVGTKDLQIKAITRNNQEIDVFTQGNFSLEFD